jgi:hypothetical protein
METKTHTQQFMAFLRLKDIENIACWQPSFISFQMPLIVKLEEDGIKIQYYY